MRYGCCVNMVTRESDVSGIDIIPLLKDTGFDYAELSLSHLCSLHQNRLDQIKALLSGYGLAAETCNNFFPPHIRLTGSAVSRKEIIRHIERAFTICRFFGTKLVVFGSGAARTVPPGFSPDEAKSQLADLLMFINGYAEDNNIIIAIEPLNRSECNIINTYGDALDLYREANCSNIKCLLDYYHLAKEREDISVIHTQENTLAHIHFSEPAGRIFPSEKNKAEYIAFFSNIMKTGYNNRLSIEAYSENFEEDARSSLTLLRKIENELNNKI